MLFPGFSCTALDLDAPGGEISWRLLHEIYEKDLGLQAHLRAAPKITTSVLHPGSCKQSVPVAIAIFDPTTIAAIRQYFPEKKDSASFLKIINVWWTICNSKMRFNFKNRLGDAAKSGNGKPEFLRSFSDRFLKQ